MKKLQPSIALHEAMKAYKELYALLFSFEKHFHRFNSQLLNSSSSLTQVVDSEKPVLVNDTPCRKYSRLWWVAGAAAVLSFWLISRADIDKSPELINNTVSTKSGFNTSGSLPDGSKISLNAISKITYDGNFDGKTREVYLSGEAFFDVAKDKLCLLTSTAISIMTTIT